MKMSSKTRQRPPFDCVALLLQGGGALGAYQGGVYEALAEAGLEPDWVAGISIGAINAALIAGNSPEARVEKLRAFWEKVTADPLAWSFALPVELGGDAVRTWANHWHAAAATIHGAPGLFNPRMIPPFVAAAGTVRSSGVRNDLLC